MVILSSSSIAVCQDKLLLSENFKDNRNAWRLRKDSSFSVEIKNGSLQLEKFTKNFDDRGCLWYKKEIKGLNTLEDFSITMYAKLLSGGDHTDLFDIQWGAWDKVILSKATSIYQLNYFLRGDVKLDHYNRGWNYSLRKMAKEISDKNLYLPNQYNKFEIIQKEGFILLNINDKQYFKQFVTPIDGNSIGFQGCLKSAWAIDKIIVRQFKTNPRKPVSPLSSPVSADSTRAGDQTAEVPLKVFPNPFKNEFTVLVSMIKASTAKIELLDVKGSVLLQYDRKLEAGNHNIRLYAEVPPGAYVVKLTIGHKITSTKLLKLG